MEEVLSSRACPPGVEEVGEEGRCHVWSVVPQAQGYTTVSTLQSITLMLAPMQITFFLHVHFFSLQTVTTFIDTIIIS